MEYQPPAEIRSLMAKITRMSPEKLWRDQPNLRMVVNFLARNTAQIGLPVYRRVSDTDRERVTDCNTARLLSRPTRGMTGFELKRALVSDLKIYDEAYWLVLPDSKAPSGWILRRLNPRMVELKDGTITDGDAVFTVQSNGGQAKEFGLDKIIPFVGYSPDDELGESPVLALKRVLAEQVASQIHREQVWNNAGRVGASVIRPKDAPEWSPEARRRFVEELRAYAGNGEKAGGWPLLEDGMTIQSNRFSAHEEQWVEAAKLALSTVAGVYHVNPTMLGSNEGVSYANVKEFRTMLYSDTLGPDLKWIQERITQFLVPIVDGEDSGLYTEFNIKEKLAASFEEQAAAYSSAVGRPYMTPDEVRARENMPALGGDAAELATPLNVLIGGQASPRDSAPKAMAAKAAGKILLKADPDEEHTRTVEQVLTRFFRRQRESVLARLGGKATPKWWDAERWDAELADDLERAAVAVTTGAAAAALRSIGMDPEAYDVDRTRKFLRSVAESRASMINAATLGQLEEAVAAGEDGPTPDDVFDSALGERGATTALTLATTYAGFAAMEAGKQLDRGRSVKRWVVNSGNPRAEHASMDGETVPVRELFSNGADWPGDPVLGADGVAGCQCSVEIEIG
ncbi:phage portal protein [Kocuria sp. CPCC 205300]|uniref:phage portal protein n=1 Tax=Kocuria sabuli TaxID=3071448 RepID=UPI0036D8D9DA